MRTLHYQVPNAKLLGAFGCGIISAIAIATPGLGAERIAFSYPPFGDFSISTDSLEVFAKEGRITPEFAFYANRVKPEQLTQLRELLQARFNVSPTMISQFTYSPLGESFLRRLGELLLTESRQNGFYAIRSALILSAADSEGLTIVNLIRRYPSQTVRLNFNETQTILGNFAEIFKRRDKIVAGIAEISSKEAKEQPIDFKQKQDLRRRGAFDWQKQTLELIDTSRQREFAVDLYLPQQSSTATPRPPFPIIVISHGLAEDKETFAYLARHLASYGFAAATVEHPGTDAKKFQQYLSGLGRPPQPTEFIDRPLDVKYLLDELQRRNESDPSLKGKLNLQQVGTVGHSLGGYTSLALAGAPIDFGLINKFCNPNRALNVSVFLQCRVTGVKPGNYPLADSRIKAVMVLNPVNGTILGPTGLSKIKVPVMMLGGGQDIFTPVVPEQIRPFIWLGSQNKYLAIIDSGTHFSVSERVDIKEQVLPVPQSLIGPDPAIAQGYVNALGVAFFETHLRERQEYRPYLSASYAQFISQAPLNLSLLQSFTAEQFTEIYGPLVVPQPEPEKAN